VALGWQFERHGWELRPYALFALVALAFVWTLEWAAEEPTWPRCSALTVAVAFGGMTHFFFAFTVVAGVAWLLSRSGLRGSRRLLVAIAIGLVPLAAWTPAFVKQYREQHFSTLPAFHLRGVVDIYANLLERSLPSGPGGALLGAAVFAVVLLGAFRLWRDPGRGRLCALAAIVPVLVAAALWLIGPHVFEPRALIGTAPFAAVALAAGLILPRRHLTVAAAAVATMLLVLGFTRGNGRIVPHYDRVATALVAEGWRPGDAILLFGSVYDYLHPLDWYLPGSERLEIVAPSAWGCSRVFVVAVGGRARVLTAPLGSRARRANAIVIGSVTWGPATLDVMRRQHGHLIAARTSACAGTAR